MLVSILGAPQAIVVILASVENRPLFVVVSMLVSGFLLVIGAAVWLALGIGRTGAEIVVTFGELKNAWRQGFVDL